MNYALYDKFKKVIIQLTLNMKRIYCGKKTMDSLNKNQPRITGKYLRIMLVAINEKL